MWFQRTFQQDFSPTTLYTFSKIDLDVQTPKISQVTLGEKIESITTID